MEQMHQISTFDGEGTAISNERIHLNSQVVTPSPPEQRR
jgi:hypothetical protein